MNCKKGDMAVIIESCAGNEGKVVTCLEYVGNPECIEGNFLVRSANGWWRVDRELNSRSLLLGDMGTMHFARDEQLMPIGNADEPVTVEEKEEEPA